MIRTVHPATPGDTQSAAAAAALVDLAGLPSPPGQGAGHTSESETQPSAQSPSLSDESRSGSDDDRGDPDYVGAWVSAPRPSQGKGSHNPYSQLQTAAELWPDGLPIELELSDWKEIRVPAQRDLCYEAHIKGRQAAGVPDWLMFTRHGMFCTTCMRSAGKVATGDFA